MLTPSPNISARLANPDRHASYPDPGPPNVPPPEPPPRIDPTNPPRREPPPEVVPEIPPAELPPTDPIPAPSRVPPRARSRQVQSPISPQAIAVWKLRFSDIASA